MKILQITFAFLFLSTMTFAQGRGIKQQKSPQDQAKARTEKLAISVGLSEDQKARVYDAKLQRIMASMEAKKTSPPNKEMMKAANMKYVETMKTILTPEQIEKAKAMAKDWKDKRASKGNRPQRTQPNNSTPSAPNSAPSDDMDDEPMF